LRPDVIVVGGGVVGCAVAWALALEGVSVRLFERGELAGEASGAAAGMLAPISESDSPGLLRDWGVRSLERFPELARELLEASGVDCEFQPSGILRVAGDDARASALEARCAELASHGVEWLAASELLRVEPSLAPSLRGALHSPREAHVRSPLLVRAYAGAASSRGARIEPFSPVLGLLRQEDRVVGVRTAAGDEVAGAVVLCTGSFSRLCASWLGPDADLPIAPVRGQIVSLDAPVRGLSRIAWSDGAYLVPKLDGSLVVGATVEHVGFDRRVTADGVRSLLAAATAVLPALADATFRGAWAGLRPDTPDHLPLVGPMPGVPGLFLAAGHYRNGVLLSPITAELVVAGLLGKGWREPAFLPDRWLLQGTS